MQSTDGKYYKTDVADTEQLFRLIQSIPSPKTGKKVISKDSAKNLLATKSNRLKSIKLPSVIIKNN